MATHTCTGVSTHQTIAAANTAETITMAGDVAGVEVINWDAAAKLYFKVDGGAATVGGDGTYVVGPGTALQVSATSSSAVPGSVDTVSLISATSGIAYSVTAVNE